MNKSGTSNIIAKLDDHKPTLLFIDKTHQIAPYRVSGCDSIEYDAGNHAYICTFSGTSFVVALSDYDIYLLTN